MDIEAVMREVGKRAGWKDAERLEIALEFIEDKGLTIDFKRFLERRERAEKRQ